MTFEGFKKVEQTLDNSTEKHEIEHATVQRLQVLKKRIEGTRSADNIEDTMERMAVEINNIEKAITKESLEHIIVNNGLDGLKDLIFLLTNKRADKVNEGLQKLDSMIPDTATKNFKDSIYHVWKGSNQKAIKYSWQTYRQEIFGRVMDMYEEMSGETVGNISFDENQISSLLEHHMSSWKEVHAIKKLQEKYGKIKAIRAYHSLTTARHDMTCKHSDAYIQSYNQTPEGQQNPLDADKGFFYTASERRRIAKLMSEKGVSGSLEEINTQLNEGLDPTESPHDIQSGTFFVMLGNGMTPMPYTSAFRVQNLVYDEKINRYVGVMENGCGEKKKGGNLVMVVPEGVDVINYGSRAINTTEKQKNKTIADQVATLYEEKGDKIIERKELQIEEKKLEKEIEALEGQETNKTNVEQDIDKLETEIAQLENNPTQKKLQKQYDTQMGNFETRMQKLQLKNSKKWTPEKVEEKRKEKKANLIKQLDNQSGKNNKPFSEAKKELEKKKKDLEVKKIQKKNLDNPNRGKTLKEKKEKLKKTKEDIKKTGEEINEINDKIDEKNTAKKTNTKKVIKKLLKKNPDLSYDEAKGTFTHTDKNGNTTEIPSGELISTEGDVNMDLVDSSGTVNAKDGKGKNNTGGGKGSGAQNGLKNNPTKTNNINNTPETPLLDESVKSDDLKKYISKEWRLPVQKNIVSTTTGMQTTIKGKKVIIPYAKNTDHSNKIHTAQGVDKALKEAGFIAQDQIDNKQKKRAKKEQTAIDQFIKKNIPAGQPKDPKTIAQIKKKIQQTPGLQKALLENKDNPNAQKKIADIVKENTSQISREKKLQEYTKKSKGKIGQLQFQRDSDTLIENNKERQKMKKLAENVKVFFSKTPEGTLQIVGHTSRHSKGLQNLSLKRAIAIKKKIIEELQKQNTTIDEKKIAVIGKGGLDPEYGDPILTNEQINDPRNQRIEVLAFDKEKKKIDLMKEVPQEPITTKQIKTTNKIGEIVGDFSTEEYINFLKNDPTYADIFSENPKIEFKVLKRKKIKIDPNEKFLDITFWDGAALDQDYFMVTLDGNPIKPEKGKVTDSKEKEIRKKYGWYPKTLDFDRYEKEYNILKSTGMNEYEIYDAMDEKEAKEAYKKADTNRIQLDLTKKQQKLVAYGLSAGDVLPNTANLNIRGENKIYLEGHNLRTNIHSTSGKVTFGVTEIIVER